MEYLKHPLLIAGFMMLGSYVVSMASVKYSVNNKKVSRGDCERDMESMNTRMEQTDKQIQKLTKGMVFVVTKMKGDPSSLMS